MIVIDPGHGGADPGCQAGGFVEKELTLRLARLVRDLAETAGLSVRLIREVDETLALAARGRRAAKFDADQVLCLHFDTNPDPAVGRLTCYCDKSDKQSESLAASIITTAPPELTLGSRTIFVEATGWKRRAYHVVHTYRTPALLVECSFLSNLHHRSFLHGPHGLPRLAVGLLSALLASQPRPGDTVRHMPSATFPRNAVLSKTRDTATIHQRERERSLAVHAKKHTVARSSDAGANQDEEEPIAILTLSEACELLRISRATMFSLLARQSIPAKKVGRCWRFDRTALIGWFRGKVATRTRGEQS